MTFPDLGRSVPLAPPLHTTSVFAIPDLDALDAIYNGEAPGFIYARDGNPNVQHLADVLTRLARGKWGVVTASGMGATSAALLAVASAGSRIVASNQLYGRTAKLLRAEFGRFGVTTTFVDTFDLDATRAALAEGPAAALVVETISNPLCRVADVPALVDLAHRAGAKLIVDNTFATPVLYRPHDAGADLVIESLTKLIGGHSDVTLGFLSGIDPTAFPAVSSLVSTWGLTANAFECWLTLRGAETLDLRVRAATANAARLADWLAVQPGVSRVVYPGREDHPDHALAARVLPAGQGNMLCFELAGGRAAVNHFMRAAPGIPFCPSLGHTTTTCSHPDTTSHRYESAAEKARQGITAGLVRLSVGCEPFDVLLAEMTKGLK
ncbi:trans-sulfuration enzyme family protein [Fimbriiglobus ruber]|uniref:O-acetylhomoserine sulfhydrylase n=1 Tax=Fimbriiglobus ruber TaxID=1908690 RepID=A0A225D7X2_9BACT|nr:aminotransferase class I/II-fold pyridoxal phosphate-dependent enzyme [Fimbriiglobus ruber]OWK37552.1 O-acetylhomoserine sulfhydrylase [Fimbriiglobus ruber]